MSLLCWGLQSWTQDARWGLTRAEQRGRITSLALLATLLLMQPRVRLAFQAASASCQLTSSFSFTSTPMSFLAGLLSVSSPPSLGAGYVLNRGFQKDALTTHVFSNSQIIVMPGPASAAGLASRGHCPQQTGAAGPGSQSSRQGFFLNSKISMEAGKMLSTICLKPARWPVVLLGNPECHLVHVTWCCWM